MVMRRALGQVLPNQGHYCNGETLYKRYTPAGPDHAQVAACAGMVDYMEALAAHHGIEVSGVHDLMRAQEVKLLQPLLDAVKDRNSVRLLGSDKAETRAPTVALSMNRPGLEVATELASHGIMAGGGDFYAKRALEAMRIDPAQGVLRLSFTHYTSEEEITKLINALDEVL
jgi:selenocysteine lyase/cysteine desulfurase